MDYVVVCLVALVGSGLTLFSGFGLGTLLLPVFALFFPVEVAIAATAVVHFLNNLFKLTLLGRKADYGLVASFGLTSLVAALVGAYVLTQLAAFEPIGSYALNGKEFFVTPVKLTVGTLLIVFAVLEMSPALERLKIDRKLIPLGGLVSGFFGGLSGHQGALRSAFLIKAGLSKEAFIATGVVIACIVDVARLTVYAESFLAQRDELNYALVGAATLAAFIGAFVGTRLMKKVTLRSVQWIVAVMLFLFGIALASGLV